MRSFKPAFAAAAVSLLLSGCSLAPAYKRPAIAVPATYKELPNGWTLAQPAADAPHTAWWESFGDPVLNGLESQIETGNPSLALAVARFDQAVGVLHQDRAALFPTIGLSSSAQRDRASGNRPLTLNPTPQTYNDYTAGASFSWQLDLFGQIRNSVRAGKFEAQATAADLAGVRLGLQTSLATAYFQMRGLDAQEELLRQTVDAFQKAYDLTVTRHDGGIGSGLDVSRARTQLSSARAELSDVHATRATFEHAIAVLVGVPASSFSLAPDARLGEPPAFPTSTPSTLLQRRPDIDAAERRVAEANARIGVARAAIFPTLSLNGAAGYETTGAGLLKTASSFWALGPAAAALTVFDGGARAAQVRISRAEFTEAAATYKQTVLNAFREVEDDLALGRDLTTEEHDGSDAAKAAEQTLDLALTQYRDGATNYLDVVTAQTAALQAELTLLNIHTRRLTTSVDSVRALGGTVGR